MIEIQRPFCKSYLVLVRMKIKSSAFHTGVRFYIALPVSSSPTRSYRNRDSGAATVDLLLPTVELPTN